MQGFKQGRDEDDKEWKAKLTAMKQKAGWDKLSDQKKKALMEDFLEDKKDAMDRKEGFRKHDMQQMNKMGYFT